MDPATRRGGGAGLSNFHPHLGAGGVTSNISRHCVVLIFLFVSKIFSKQGNDEFVYTVVSSIWIAFEGCFFTNTG